MNTVSQPYGMTVPLYQHQLASIYQMEKFESDKHVVQDGCVIEMDVGIYGDISGYGKTLGIVGLICRDKMEWNSYPYSIETIQLKSNNHIKVRTTQNYDKLNCTLIVADPSITKQWFDELSTVPTIKKIIVSTRKLIVMVKVEDYDVIIVTPTMYNAFVLKYHNLAWKRFIYDEPGHIRIKSMTNVIAGFYWLVTATPELIPACHSRCRVSFMRYLIGNNSYDFEVNFKHLILKNDIDFIKRSFIMPQIKHYYYECYQPIYNALKGIAPYRITEMIAAGNITGAIKELGGNEISNLTELLKDMKLKELNNIEKSTQECKDCKVVNEDRLQILTAKHSRITKQLLDLDQRIKDMLTEDCSICQDTLTEPVLEQGCQNLFCGVCLLTWCQNKQTCPLCRNNIDLSTLTHIKNKEESKEEPKEKLIPRTKPNVLLDILKAYPNGKFIIFSGYDKTFSNIKDLIHTNGYTTVELSGHVNSTEKALEKFKSGKAQILFLNSGKNGTGINLQEATDMIFYHEMSDNQMTQLLGRMNRIGRTKDSRIHHLQIGENQHP